MKSTLCLDIFGESKRLINMDHISSVDMHPADDYGFFSDYVRAVGISILGVEEIPIAFFKTEINAECFFDELEFKIRNDEYISDLRKLIALHSGDIIDLDDIR